MCSPTLASSSEQAAAAAKAARKAARKAAKEAVVAEAMVEEEEVQPEKKPKAKAKKAKKAEEVPAEVEEEATAVKKVEKKVQKAAAEKESDVAVATPKRKRKAHLDVDEEATPADATDKKKRKGNDGSAADPSVAAFREAHEIIVPSACPDPIQTFDAAIPVLGKQLGAALVAQGFKAPTPIQAQAWPIALSGQDMVAVAKTGSGKTCGFLLPALARIQERGPAPPPAMSGGWVTQPAQPGVLVVAPTRELAQQIAAEAERFAPVVRARVVTVYGGVGKGDQIQELRRGCDVLIATPGRLLDFAAGDEKRGLAAPLSLSKVTYLVLDEADRMLDMGFEADIRRIVGQCPKTGKPEQAGGATGPQAGTMRQTLFFTATWPKEVQAIASTFTAKQAVQVRIGQGSDGEKLTANTSVKQQVMVIQQNEKAAALKKVLDTELKDGETAIIFAQMKSTCNDLERNLKWVFPQGSGLWCKALHSGKEQWDRDEALSTFRAITASVAGPGRGEFRRGALIATDVAARGLDIPGVALVVVYDFGRALSGMNGGVESYVHRIGRTGRAGRMGRAITFFTPQDMGAPELIELLRGAKQEVPPGLLQLADSEGYKRYQKDVKTSQYKKGGGKGKGAGKGKGGGGKGKGKGKRY